LPDLTQVMHNDDDATEDLDDIYAYA